MNEPNAQIAARLDGVRYAYGRQTALDGVSLEVPAGCVLGLVGRNGAGKTTILRLLMGLLHAAAGEVRTLGLCPRKDAIAVRTRAGILLEPENLFPSLRVAGHLDLVASLHPRFDRDYAAQLLKDLDLDPKAKPKALSRGGKAKLLLTLTLAPRPDLLLLDDPTAGLDPLVRKQVLGAILKAIPDDGGTVVYASHLVHDLERLADRIAILDRGKLHFHGATQELQRRIRGVSAVFRDAPPADLRVPGQLTLEREGRQIRAVIEGDVQAVLASLETSGATHVESSRLSLEDILVAFLGRDDAGDSREAA